MERVKIMENQMKHYINNNKEIFGFELDGSQDHLITKDMVEISLEEIEAINKAKEDEYKNSIAFKVQEYKLFLDKTDKKVLPDYEFKEGDNSLEWYIEERSKARAFIRANEVI